MGPLVTMAREYGWTHDYMMSMPQRLFYRYYGIWLIRRIQEEEDREQEARKRELDRKMEDNRQWHTL